MNKKYTNLNKTIKTFYSIIVIMLFCLISFQFTYSYNSTDAAKDLFESNDTDPTIESIKQNLIESNEIVKSEFDKVNDNTNNNINNSSTLIENNDNENLKYIFILFLILILTSIVFYIIKKK